MKLGCQGRVATYLGLTPSDGSLFEKPKQFGQGSYERRKGSYELYWSLQVLTPFLPKDSEGAPWLPRPCVSERLA